MILPLDMPFARPGECQHPQVSDQELAVREERIAATWGAVDHVLCPDCREYLFPYDEGERVVVLVGEPANAGLDPRPDPATHPDYWSE